MLTRHYSKTRIARAAARGVTLVEVLIVVTILAMISGAVVVAVLPKLKSAKIKTAQTNARAIRQAVQRWRANHGGTECPTISQLKKDKEIDTASKTTDPWERPYKIRCEEDETIVISAGPDKREGTKDDIIIPPPSDDEEE